MSDQQHKIAAGGISAQAAIITLSDTRTPATDTSGQRIAALLAEAGHQVRRGRIIPDEPHELRGLLEQFTSEQDLDLIISTGGTGIARRDQTVPVIESFIDTPLPGFGELFRMLSWEQVGSAAMLSRAVAGIARGKLLFALPGSTKAVELAMTKLIIPELRHLLAELRR